MDGRFKPLTKEALLGEIMFYIENGDPRFGGIENWNVSNITDMSNLFSGLDFDYDISQWDVSNVTTMYRMFESCSNFNQDIGEWDVGNVTTMKEMFREATSFNQDIGDWDVGNVTDMREMFYNASDFSQDLSRWIISEETVTDNMFRGNTLMSTTDIPSIVSTDEGIPEGLAYEIHAIFNGIGTVGLLNVIGVEKGRSLHYSSSKPFSNYVEDTLSLLLELDDDEEDELFDRYEGLLPTIRGIDGLGMTSSQIDLAYTALRYVLRQNEMFKLSYIREFLTSCTEAYEPTGSSPRFNPEDPTKHATCTKGLFERIILSLSSAASYYLSKYSSPTDDSYEDLIQVMNPLTRSIMADLAASCRTKHSARLNRLSSGANIQEHIGIYRDCMRKKLITSGRISEDGDNPIILKEYIRNDIKPLVTEMADDQGGKKKSRRKKYRKTKKKSRANKHRTNQMKLFKRNIL